MAPAVQPDVNRTAKPDLPAGEVQQLSGEMRRAHRRLANLLELVALWIVPGAMFVHQVLAPGSDGMKGPSCSVAPHGR